MGNKRDLLTPWDPWSPRDESHYDGKGKWGYTPLPEPEDRGRAMTPTQALMECGPGEEPQPSQVELLDLREVIADAMESFSPWERNLLEARLIARRPLRKLERVMGMKKSALQRHERRLVAELRSKLEDHPAIVQYLSRHDSQEPDA